MDYNRLNPQRQVEFSIEDVKKQAKIYQEYIESVDGRTSMGKIKQVIDSEWFSGFLTGLLAGGIILLLL